MRRAQRLSRPQAVVPRHLAGWLFADVFLVLMLIAFAMSQPALPHTPGRPGHPSPSPSPVPTASRTGQTVVGLDPHSVQVSIPVGNGPVQSGQLTSDAARAVLGRVAEAVARDPQRRGVGFVITSGLAPTAEQGPAQQLAAAVNAMLRQKLTTDFCGHSNQQVVFRDEWRYSGSSDTVRVELFFVNGCRLG